MEHDVEVVVEDDEPIYLEGEFGLTPVRDRGTAESRAMEDYRAMLGRSLYVEKVMSDRDEYEAERGELLAVRIVETPEDLVIRWMGDHLDAQWRVEFIDSDIETAEGEELAIDAPGYLPIEEA